MGREREGMKTRHTMKERRGILCICGGMDMKGGRWSRIREFLSAASDRSLRRTGTQTGLLLATGGEALAAASLAASKTYMWVYVWVCVFRLPPPAL